MQTPFRLLSAALLTTLLLAGCGREPQGKRREADFQGRPTVDLEQVYSMGDYRAAVPLLREKLKNEPENGREWFRLGYALHSLGQLDEAIEAHANAAKFDEEQRFLALYNWGCALALNGQADEAFKRLTEAVEAGFTRKRQIIDDPDLDSLRRDPRFQKLLESVIPPEGSEQDVSRHTNFNFFIGEWDLEDSTAKRIASLTVRSSHNGYVITEQWQAGRRRSGSSMTHFDPVAGQWKQTRVNSDGGVVYYTGEYRDDAMHFEGEELRQNGNRQLSRLLLRPNADDGTIQYLMTRSEDGENWETIVEGVLVARKPALTN